MATRENSKSDFFIIALKAYLDPYNNVVNLVQDPVNYPTPLDT